MAEPNVEYEDRIVRFPGEASYRLQLRRAGELAVVDGHGGKTIGRILLNGGDVRWEAYEPEDLATLERVALAWTGWCLANGKPPWPR